MVNMDGCGQGTNSFNISTELFIPQRTSEKQPYGKTIIFPSKQLKSMVMLEFVKDVKETTFIFY